MKACEQSEENLEDKKESVKFLAAMVRDANRLKLKFNEVSDLLETHRTVEGWIDRANIAVRSRMCLKEIRALIQKGDELPVNLSDFMEKLRVRVGQAEEWVDRFKGVVPYPNLDGSELVESDKTLLCWMEGVRRALHDGKHTALHDLASEGNRIPVEVEIMKLLQLELDAKSWTMKAKKWVPCLAKDESVACKKAKLEDLREHLDKAALLRERLNLSESAKNEWVVEGEMEIRNTVQGADDWFEKVSSIASPSLVTPKAHARLAW
jgi:PLU-1-like protein